MNSVKLLSFQRDILRTLTGPSPEADGLLLIAQGLGLRAIVVALLKHYGDSSKSVLVLNVTEDEQESLRDDLGMKLQICSYETPARERSAPTAYVTRHTSLNANADADARSEMYKRGSIISLTTQVLVIDMLTKTCPHDQIRGLMIFHAEKYVSR